jgi:acyl carrier protein
MIEELQELVRQYTDNKEVTITADTILLNDLGLNSYELVQLVSDLEERFDIEIPDRAISDFKTVYNVLDYIETCK